MSQLKTLPENPHILPAEHQDPRQTFRHKKSGAMATGLGQTKQSVMEDNYGEINSSLFEPCSVRTSKKEGGSL